MRLSSSLSHWLHAYQIILMVLRQRTTHFPHLLHLLHLLFLQKRLARVCGGQRLRAGLWHFKEAEVKKAAIAECTMCRSARCGVIQLLRARARFPPFPFPLRQTRHASSANCSSFLLMNLHNRPELSLRAIQFIFLYLPLAFRSRSSTHITKRA